MCPGSAEEGNSEFSFFCLSTKDRKLLIITPAFYMRGRGNPWIIPHQAQNMQSDMEHRSLDILRAPS
uniref:Uncharacterized protein n=1 Tax=Anguilla anguilla TaxID=7936 RepID=A0A0E9QRZ7_ANGAN